MLNNISPECNFINRFIRSMADAMGGEEGENYARFKTFCCQVRQNTCGFAYQRPNNLSLIFIT